MFRTGDETEERDPLSWIDLKDSPKYEKKTRVMPGTTAVESVKQQRVRILQAASDRQHTLKTKTTLNNRKVNLMQVEKDVKASETTDQRQGHSIVNRLT